MVLGMRNLHDRRAFHTKSPRNISHVGYKVANTGCVCEFPVMKLLQAYVYTYSGRGVKLTTHLHLAPRSNNEWSYTSTPQYVFMVWYSGKKEHRNKRPFTCVCVCVCVCVCMYVCMYVCMCVCVCIYIYIMWDIHRHCFSSLI
jgi:hypothetical protein